MIDASFRSGPAVEIVTKRTGPGAVYATVGLVFLLLAAAVGFLVWRANRTTPESIQQAAQVLQAGLEKGEVEKRVSEAHLATNKAKASHHRLAADCRQLRSQLDKFTRSYLAWHNSVADLLQNEAGMRIAVAEDLVQEYELLRDHQGPPPLDGVRLAALANEVEARCTTAIDTQGALADPARQDVDSVAEQLARVAAAQDSVAKADVALVALVTRAAGRDPGSTKLADALRLRREQLDGELRARIQAEAARVARAEVEEKAKVVISGLERRLAQEVEALQLQVRHAQEREVIKLNQVKAANAQELVELKATAEAELDKQKAEASAARVRFEREIDRATRESQRLREEMTAELRRMKCDSLAVRDLLAPFLAQGYWQPTPDMEQRIERRPISLSLLNSVDAMSPTAYGLGKLYEIAATGEDRERPRWRAYDSYIFDNHIKEVWFRDHPESLEHAKKAQALLVELGPCLVERNLLAK